MSILTLRIPKPDNKEFGKHLEDDRMIDPRGLAYWDSYQGSAHEIAENPLITPQMLNELRDLSRDELEED